MQDSFHMFDGQTIKKQKDIILDLMLMMMMVMLMIMMMMVMLINP